MSLIHDIIKIKYSNMGYLPGYPYHLISDKEMFDAFICLDSKDETKVKQEHFFDDNYPNPFEEEDILYKKLDKEGNVVSEVSLKDEYGRLKDYIVDCIIKYIEDDSYTIPDWIYTYMIGEVIYNDSAYLDIHDALVLLGDADNIDNKFTNRDCALCYATSLKYISTLTSGIRPPTVFGEPHVIKQLRLEA